MTSLRTRGTLRIVLAFVFIGSGIFHFVTPGFFLQIMPPYLPWHLELVYVSGFFEILGGIGLLVPALRRIACWGLIALLIAVFPANVQMMLDWYEKYGWSVLTILSIARLPLQPLLILWVWTCCKEPPTPLDTDREGVLSLSENEHRQAASGKEEQP